MFEISQPLYYSYSTAKRLPEFIAKRAFPRIGVHPMTHKIKPGDLD